MIKVKKRNGELVSFDRSKIENALRRAFSSVGQEVDECILQSLINDVKVPDGADIVDVENIQDQVEESLMAFHYYNVAKAYILYRAKHSESRFIRERLEYMNEYVNSDNNAASSSETDANANVTIKNVANLEGEVYKIKNRIIQRQRMKDKLNELYPEVAKQYGKDLEDNIIYAHDEATSPALKKYCLAATLYPLMLEGTGNIDGVTPTPPNDIQSFSGQVTNLVFLLSSQARGAVALGDYCITLNYYIIQEFGNDWYKILDKLTTSEYNKKQRTVKDIIRKGIKQFIYGVNQPAGNRSYNSPFTNISFYDKYYFKALFEDFMYPDGTKPEWIQIDNIQRIFMELLRELRLIKPLTFPVTTMALLHDGHDCLDKEYKQLCAEEWAKGGSFFCYINDNPSSISSCCRVANEITDNVFSSTTGMTGIMTGSCNVITLNINRIVQNYVRENGSFDKNFEKYFIKILERVYKYQIAYKTMLYDMEDKGMYSDSNAGYIYLKKLYCTIGVIGYFEAAKFLGYDVGETMNSDTEKYVQFLQFIFKIIQEQNRKHSIHDKKRPFIFNLEATPCENLAIKFYDNDKKDGYTVPKDQNLYNNYFYSPWGTESVLDKLRLHGKSICQYLSGGQAAHIGLDAHLSKEQYLKIIDFCIKEGVNYFTFNIPISECKDCGHVVNAPIKECPKCHSKKIDWWTRVVGFLRPISTFSKGRQIEASKRIYSNGREEIK